MQQCRVQLAGSHPFKPVDGGPNDQFELDRRGESSEPLGHVLTTKRHDCFPWWTNQLPARFI
jgi:hypothetical protein